MYTYVVWYLWVVSVHDAGASSSLAFFSDGELDASSSAFRLDASFVSAAASPLASGAGFFFFLTIEVKSFT